jgi:hypothetical protein
MTGTLASRGEEAAKKLQPVMSGRLMSSRIVGHFFSGAASRPCLNATHSVAVRAKRAGEHRRLVLRHR